MDKWKRIDMIHFFSLVILLLLDFTFLSVLIHLYRSSIEKAKKKVIQTDFMNLSVGALRSWE